MKKDHIQVSINNSIYIKVDLSMSSGDWKFVEYSGSRFYDSTILKGNHRQKDAHVNKMRVDEECLRPAGYRLATPDQVDFFLGKMKDKEYDRHVYFLPDGDNNNIVDRIDWRKDNLKGVR